MRNFTTLALASFLVSGLAIAEVHKNNCSGVLVSKRILENGNIERGASFQKIKLDTDDSGNTLAVKFDSQDEILQMNHNEELKEATASIDGINLKFTYNEIQESDLFNVQGKKDHRQYAEIQFIRQDGSEIDTITGTIECVDAEKDVIKLDRESLFGEMKSHSCTADVATTEHNKSGLINSLSTQLSLNSASTQVTKE